MFGGRENNTAVIGKCKGAVRRTLLPWFEANARDLPWRRHRTPYRVWVAEIMLQQTRVGTAIPYYRRWMRAFPSWRSLARASQGEVLKCWEGLGYYSRARRLHAAAARITGLHAGNVARAWTAAATPATAERIEKGLLDFPGIGPYTAAAIASLAFGADTAAVDGNVARIVCRLTGWTGDPDSTAGRTRMRAAANALLPRGRAAEFNEAMMDLGATVCRPVNPVCRSCPLRTVCTAFAAGRPEKYPVRKEKPPVPHIVVGAAVVSDRRRRTLIAQRRETDMLGGLWEFPGGKQEARESIRECIAREIREELGIAVSVGPHLTTVRHAYSHFTMTMHVHRARIASGRPRPLQCADYAWVTPAEMAGFAFSKADLDVVAMLRAETKEDGAAP